MCRTAEQACVAATTRPINHSRADGPVSRRVTPACSELPVSFTRAWVQTGTNRTEFVARLAFIRLFVWWQNVGWSVTGNWWRA